jgi:integrase
VLHRFVHKEWRSAAALRVGEYLRLTDTDLLPVTKQVRVPGTKTTGSTATLPVAPEMWEWVRRAVPSPLQYKWLREYWVRARKSVGADDERLHDLRHLPAQLLANAGRPEASIQSTMRHATPSSDGDGRVSPTVCPTVTSPQARKCNSGGGTRTPDTRIMIMARRAA